LAMLNGWNGEMLADRPEPLIFNAWTRELSRQIFADELGPELMKDYWYQSNMQASMTNVLKDVSGAGRWCRNVSDTSGKMPQTCADVMSASLDTAIVDLQKHYGKDMSAWRWGNAHEARSEHRPFSKVPALAKLFDIRVPSPGDTYTIDVGRYNMLDEHEPFVNHHAASLRVIYDLSNLENSRFIHSTGESGNFLSPLYKNFSQRWVDVSYLPMQTKRESVEKDKLGTLVLTP